MSDQFEKMQNELWDALVALARTMPLDPALKDAHSRLSESGHGETLLASIASKITIEPGLAESGPESDQAPVTVEVAESIEKIGEIIVQPSIDRVLSRLPGKLAEQAESAEMQDLIRLIAVREAAKINMTGGEG